MRYILATDCGSTTTKAILIEKIGGEYHQTYRGEAPTTVEAPVEDVTVGVINAITEVQELAERKLLDNNQIIKPRTNDEGVDLYISTSSAGGGLQMMVAGAVRNLTAESAERAALGAGAIVMDVIASNDKRLPHEKIDQIRQLRPDMILLSGGVDGGSVTHVAELAEIVAAANPKPRLGVSYQMPVIFAGNKDATDIVREKLGSRMSLEVVDNLRPTMERENLMPTRLKIQDQFLEHVMMHAPGYKKLIEWTDTEIMPTPGAVGAIMQTIAEQNRIQVVGVDIGGATTDVFSVFQNQLGESVFNRTVSANLGMSYSISNVLAEAGMGNILRWLPFDINLADLQNRIKNKMIRPTTIPQLLEELIIEHAIAREALRLAFEQHKKLAVELKGVQQQRTISEAFAQTETGNTLVNMFNLNLIVGSGGVLSHAPRRQQSMLMMIDSFLPEGVTQLAVDSIFMMPQLGVLSQVNKEAATQVFNRDCLIHLGTCIAPTGQAKKGSSCLEISVNMSSGIIEETIPTGELKLYKMGMNEVALVKIQPNRHFDVGAGSGQVVETEVRGGVVGLVIDTRGRPLEMPTDTAQYVADLKKWMQTLDVYPL
ncbi:TPA: methylaspartate mutase [Candidatus Poribacteria bacterium]|nr:methylaspartate mutase [Candidatus Poribacteria bacterium]HIA67884.1 methylaspartate mutase [Candidatus Poribacteria bacterium]HIC00931.1 methylaspartate mutase [Candidatus Poribacteria bacterium]HIO45899.1 methylaspartate mutase [Candidatus Poribacteria bacterium]HIO79438.1 methylaspartate mutase [Candidatus Poribacteria bacterium]